MYQIYIIEKLTKLYLLLSNISLIMRTIYLEFKKIPQYFNDMSRPYADLTLSFSKGTILPFCFHEYPNNTDKQCDVNN